MEDIQIIDLYWRRDEQAIGETDSKYGGFCHKLSMNILHSFQDSEECVSDAYIRCWDTMPPQRPASLRAYLGAILRNLSISRYRAAHASPNSAWSEAAFAGALGLRLGGPVSYRGRPAPYPWLGEGRPDAGSRDIERSIALMRVVTAVFGLGCCAALAVCGG